MAKIDDSVKKKVPELRFKGFTDDWEQRKLSNESTITAGGDIDKAKLKEVGEYPIFANALTNDGTVGYYDSYYRVEAPAVTVTGRGDVGHAKARKVNFTPVVRLLAVKSNHDVDFLENAINNHKVLVESTGVPQLTAPQLGNYKIFFPTGEEQQKIGSFFKQLDDTIDLHQRKLDLLKEQKKGYLQKMFPKNGAKVPELRFAGFADDWEDRKLSDIVVRLTKSSNNNQLPKVEFEDIIAGEGRLNKDISRKFDDRKGTLFEPDNILYGKLRPYLKNWLFSDFKGIALGDFWVFKSINSEPKFIYSLIQADNYQRVANDTSGTKMPRSDWKKVSSSNFSIPTSLEEQEKIGSFFKQLDDTIALHQRKLDLLKEQKKGFLQKMFV
ncbi:restriction endonuclease subunit S [Lactococcus lactis]|uniref:restriction endonuclease subunit S n=1 Tax=Lactococcus lactis TaxID=1358 RepID=UPI0021AF11BA|nr:restriction endonuclease subunit S [Lactococcus lactis]